MSRFPPKSSPRFAASSAATLFSGNHLPSSISGVSMRSLLPRRNEVRMESGICVVRSWRRSDKSDLVRYANNAKLARNLRDACPNPYTVDDADRSEEHTSELQSRRDLVC